MKITLLFQLDLLLFANPNQHPPLSLARMSSIPRGEEFSRFKMSSEIDLHNIFTFTQVFFKRTKDIKSYARECLYYELRRAINFHSHPLLVFLLCCRVGCSQQAVIEDANKVLC